MDDQWIIRWHDSGRAPQCAPNPRYPQGVHVDMSAGAVPSCETPLPYPARRCGYYVVACRLCSFRGAITTAGRPDDPCAVRVACQRGTRLG